MQEEGDVGVGELSRQVRDVLVRFEGLATRLDGQFVREDNFKLYQRLVDQAILSLQNAVKELASLETVKNLRFEVEGKASRGQVAGLEEDIKELQDDKKWLVRLIVGFIVMGVLAAVIVIPKLGA
jgi:hypothetical protein